MKKKYCFLIDTSADPSIKKLDPNINVMHVEIIAAKDGKEQIYSDWLNITREKVLELLAKGYDLKTSQPSIGFIEAKIEELLAEYEYVFVLPLTKYFSGTYNSCVSVKKDLEKKFGKNRILVADSKSISYMQNSLLLFIKNLVEKGADMATIEKEIKGFDEKFMLITSITNATQLIKGGRLTGLKAILVKALNLKLILKFRGGKLEFADKSTNLNAAIDKMVTIVANDMKLEKNKVKRVVIMSDLPTKAETDASSTYLKNKLKPYFSGNFETGLLPTTIITHLGDYSFTFYLEIE
ncbi:MAG: DegV family protein [Mycoplasma sp.]